MGNCTASMPEQTKAPTEVQTDNDEVPILHRPQSAKIGGCHGHAKNTRTTRSFSTSQLECSQSPEYTQSMETLRSIPSIAKYRQHTPPQTTPVTVTITNNDDSVNDSINSLSHSNSNSNSKENTNCTNNGGTISARITRSQSVLDDCRYINDNESSLNNNNQNNNNNKNNSNNKWKRRNGNSNIGYRERSASVQDSSQSLIEYTNMGHVRISKRIRNQSFLCHNCHNLFKSHKELTMHFCNNHENSGVLSNQRVRNHLQYTTVGICNTAIENKHDNKDGNWNEESKNNNKDDNDNNNNTSKKTIVLMKGSVNCRKTHHSRTISGSKKRKRRRQQQLKQRQLQSQCLIKQQKNN